MIEANNIIHDDIEELHDVVDDGFSRSAIFFKRLTLPVYKLTEIAASHIYRINTNPSVSR